MSTNSTLMGEGSWDESTVKPGLTAMIDWKDGFDSTQRDEAYRIIKEKIQSLYESKEFTTFVNKLTIEQPKG